MIKKNIDLKSVFGILGIFISILLILFFNKIIEFLFYVGENYISEDKSVNIESMWLLEWATIGLISVTFTLSILYFTNFYPWVLKQFAKVFDVKKIHWFFIKDDLSNHEGLSKANLIIATVSGILLHLYFLIFGEPTHEGFIEEFSSIFILISAFLLILGLRYLKNEFFTPFWYRTHQFTLIFLGLMLFLLFGEEINWGQRVLEIEPSEFFKTYNFQDEISFHNFFNPIFIFIYPIVGMFSFIALIFLWIFYRGKKNHYLKLFIPHKSLFFLIFWMACASYTGDSEIYEEMLTVFFLLYSLRILFSLKNLSNNYRSKSLQKELSYIE